MKPSDEIRLTPELVEAYLDGTLDDTTRGRLDALHDDASSAEGAQLREAIIMQKELDRRLHQAFVVPPVPPLDLSQAAASQPADVDAEPADAFPRDSVAPTRTSSDSTPQATSSRNGAVKDVKKHTVSPPSRPGKPKPRRFWRHLTGNPTTWKTAVLLVVASAAWLMVARSFWPKDSQVVFRNRPLEEVYEETIDFGFEPYYICDEPDRFRDTFFYRHGQPLKLAELPDDRQMVGLSYLHGVSRHTTAMLARAQGEPVIVFIDRLDRDRPIKAPSSDRGLHLFRRELNNLVMYEITPFDHPSFLDYLMPTDPPPDPCLDE